MTAPLDTFISSQVEWPSACKRRCIYRQLKSIIVSVLSHLDLAWLDPPTDQRVVVGQDVTFRCAVSGLGEWDFITWSRIRESDTPFTLFFDNSAFGDDDRYSVESNGNGYDMTISGVDRSDAHQFRCAVLGTDFFRTISLTVIGKCKIIQLMQRIVVVAI